MLILFHLRNESDGSDSGSADADGGSAGLDGSDVLDVQTDEMDQVVRCFWLIR